MKKFETWKELKLGKLREKGRMSWYWEKFGRQGELRLGRIPVRQAERKLGIDNIPQRLKVETWKIYARERGHELVLSFKLSGNFIAEPF